MATLDNVIDLSVLSEQSKHALVDFYQLLLRKQHFSRKKLPPIFYKPIKSSVYHQFNRAEIYDAR